MKNFKFSALSQVALLLLTGCAISAQSDDDLSTMDQQLVVSSAACSVEYLVTSQWTGGFGATLQVTNKGAPVNSWKVGFLYADGQRVTSLWNGSVAQSGGQVTVSDAGWNAALGTNQSVAVGFNGSYGSVNSLPSNFTLNGVSCGGTNTTPAPNPGGGATGGTSGTGGSTSSGCTASTWQAGRQYAVGDIVTYQGALYIAVHANPGYDPTISTWFWSPYNGTCGGTSTGSGGSSGGSGGSGTGLGAILSEAHFNQLFPRRNSFYTYAGLIQAAALYPAFGGTGDLTTRKREVAAFLGNVTHETGDLVYVEEINRGGYCDSSPWFCPCEPGKSYYGRGPIQLSWNYNYCAASQSIFGDREVLRRNPERVAQEPWLAWATALWFWMTQNGAGTMTAHNAMVNQRGFGETIRTINGGLECNGANPHTVQLRIGYYQEVVQLFGVSAGHNLGC
jgi:predicted chitinase